MSSIPGSLRMLAAHRRPWSPPSIADETPGARTVIAKSSSCCVVGDVHIESTGQLSRES